jgi:hypothetical protein
MFILGRQYQNRFVFKNRSNNKEVIAPERGKTGGDHAADALAAKPEVLEYKLLKI